MELNQLLRVEWKTSEEIQFSFFWDWDIKRFNWHWFGSGVDVDQRRGPNVSLSEPFKERPTKFFVHQSGPVTLRISRVATL